MKINNNPRRKSKKLFLPLLVVAIILSSWLVFAYVKGAWPFMGASREDTTTEQTITAEEQKEVDSENAQQKQDFLDKQYSDEDKPSTGENPKNDTEANRDSPQINLSARTQDNLLVVTTDLGRITSGECKLTLKQGEKSIWKTAKVIFAPNSSTCEGFSIDKSELNNGAWQITLSVKTDSETVSKSINYTL